MNTDALYARAHAWVAGDVDHHDARALTQLIDAKDVLGLADQVGRDLRFGTAGLRAPMGPGSNRMNRATVIRTTWAVARWLETRGVEAPTVVVGFDARHNSQTFASDVVAVLAACGVRVNYFPEPVATPLVAFAQKHFAADAAIVITASHNPASDNGYKLYGEGASQIVAPDDVTMQQLIAVAPAANAIVRHSHDSPLVTQIDDTLFAAYEAMVVSLHITHVDWRPRIVYTPLHGVGAAMFLRVAGACGYDDVTVVASQQHPDPDFSTVAFPNPEEPGALDEAFATASMVGADLIIANDPDADRLAIAVPTRLGSFVALSGNQIGVLLSDYLLEHATGVKPLIVTTVVSTPMVNAVAHRHGAEVERTFTGFKWIAQAKASLVACGHTFVYGFEEALGSNVTSAVNDKDGISAAIVFADLVAWLHGRGETVADRLITLGVIDGVWVSKQVSVVRTGLTGEQAITDAMTCLLGDPPKLLGGRRVVGVTDYTNGAQMRPVWRGDDRLVELAFADGRVLVRPSGTEPKLKVYVDLRFSVDSRDEVAGVEAQGEREAEQIANLLLTHIGIL